MLLKINSLAWVYRDCSKVALKWPLAEQQLLTVSCQTEGRGHLVIFEFSYIYTHTHIHSVYVNVCFLASLIIVYMQSVLEVDLHHK